MANNNKQKFNSNNGKVDGDKGKNGVQLNADFFGMRVTLEREKDNHKGGMPHSGRKPAAAELAAKFERAPRMETEDDFEQDRLAISDYLKKVSDSYNKVLSYDALNGAPADQVDEYQLTNVYSDLAQELTLASRRYYSAVAGSKTSFYTEEQKRVALEKMVEIDEILAGPSHADIRQLRAQLMSMDKYFLTKPFTKLDLSKVKSVDDLYDVISAFQYDSIFTPVTSDTSDPNSRVRPVSDPRGEADINLPFYLHILPITPFFKKKLRAMGVSDSLLDELGNYTLDPHEEVDEDHEFSDSSFIDISDQLGLDSSDNRIVFKRYTGPSFYRPIQEDLLKYLDQARRTALRTYAKIQRESSGGASDGVKETFNPDFALKCWMRLALNAVYKVLVEDGLGFMDRVNSSLATNAKKGLPSEMPDLVCQLLNSNKHFSKKLFDDVKERVLTSKSFSYSKVVYDFLKVRFAPVETSFESKTKRYLDEQQMPPQEFKIRLIPCLVLPVNPYDSAAEYFFKKAANSTVVLGNYDKTYETDLYNASPDEYKKRALMYCSHTLANAYRVRGSNAIFTSLTMHMDNMLSFALFAIWNNKRYNTVAYKSRLLDKSGSLTSPTDFTDLTKVYESGSIEGPWVTHKNDSSITTSKYRSWAKDFYASFHDRRVVLGNTESKYGTYISPVTGLSCVSDAFDEDKENDYLVTPIQLASYHTNELSVRLTVCSHWFVSNPIFIKRAKTINERWTRFSDGVVEKGGELMGVKTASAASPTFSAKSSDVGGLSARHFFRYSAYKSDDGMRLFDNYAAGKVPNVHFSLGYGTTPNDRRKSALLTNVEKMSSDTDLRKAYLPEEAMLYPFSGIEQAASARLGGAVSVKSLASRSGVDPASGESVNSFIANDGYCESSSYVNSQLPFFWVPKYKSSSSKDSYKTFITFGGVGKWNVFTKRVNLLSCRTATTTQKISYTNPLVASDTILKAYGGVEGMIKFMSRWATSVKRWNRANPILETYGANTDEFDVTVDYILAPFSKAGFDFMDTSSSAAAAYDPSSANPAVSIFLHSCSACYAVASNCGDTDIDKSHPINMVLNPYQYRNLTSLGQVVGQWTWADPDSTTHVMSKLKQVIIDQLNNKTYMHCDTAVHGFVVAVRDNQVIRDERSLWYEPWCQDAVYDPDSYSVDDKPV